MFQSSTNVDLIDRVLGTNLHTWTALISAVRSGLPVTVIDTLVVTHRITTAEVDYVIRNSPNANNTLKNATCDFGGAAMAESGGNTCADNGNNYGVLQLTRGNLPAGMTPQQYKDLPVQQQVDIWAQQVGNSDTSGGYGTLANNSTFGGTQVTSGMQSAASSSARAFARKTSLSCRPMVASARRTAMVA